MRYYFCYLTLTLSKKYVFLLSSCLSVSDKNACHAEGGGGWAYGTVLYGSYFANPHPPVPAILKTASDPCSDSSVNHLPHLTRPAYKLIPTPDPHPKKKQDIRWNAGALHYLVFGVVL